MLQKEREKGKKEVEVAGSELASPGRVEEPEPHVVAEPLDKMSGIIVAEDEEDVWVEPVAKYPVAESGVAEEVDVPEALVRLPNGKKRRLNVGGGRDEDEDEAEVMTVIPVEEERNTIVAPVGPRLDVERNMGMVPVGPRLGAGPRGRGWDIVRREYRFVDRSLIGVRNGMVGDSYHTRGGGARAQVRGNFRGGGRGHVYPFR